MCFPFSGKKQIDRALFTSPPGSVNNYSVLILAEFFLKPLKTRPGTIAGEPLEFDSTPVGYMLTN